VHRCSVLDILRLRIAATVRALQSQGVARTLDWRYGSRRTLETRKGSAGRNRTRLAMPADPLFHAASFACRPVCRRYSRERHLEFGRQPHLCGDLTMTAKNYTRSRKVEIFLRRSGFSIRSSRTNCLVARSSLLLLKGMKAQGKSLPTRNRAKVAEAFWGEAQLKRSTLIFAVILCCSPGLKGMALVRIFAASTHTMCCHSSSPRSAIP
jgi:hypothetical protein